MLLYYFLHPLPLKQLKDYVQQITPIINRITPHSWDGVAEKAPVFGENRKFADYRKVTIGFSTSTWCIGFV